MPIPIRRQTLIIHMKEDMDDTHICKRLHLCGDVRDDSVILCKCST